MAAESQEGFVARNRRQRDLFKELNAVGSAERVLAIDAMRRGRGETTELGNALRSLYAEETVADQRSKIFNRRSRSLDLATSAAPEAASFGGMLPAAQPPMAPRQGRPSPSPEVRDLLRAVPAQPAEVSPTLEPEPESPLPGLDPLIPGNQRQARLETDLIKRHEEATGVSPDSFQREQIRKVAETRVRSERGSEVNNVGRAFGLAEDALDTPRNMLFAALFSGSTSDGIKNLWPAFTREEIYSGRDVPLLRHMSDTDIIGSWSPRDIAGGIAEIMLDPLDVFMGGMIITDVVKGTRAALRQLGDVRRAKKAVPQTPLQDLIDNVRPGEDIARAGFKNHEGQVRTQGLEIQQDLEYGNDLLRDLGIGRRVGNQLQVERINVVDEGVDAGKALLPVKDQDSADMVALFKALHGEGEVPVGYEHVYRELRRQVDIETVATTNFDAKFMAHPNYFPRGWVQKDPSTGRKIIKGKKGFVEPRVDATFTEMLEGGWEPVSWNPFEMVALRRVAGAQFREERTLLRYLHEQGLALPVRQGEIPAGWEVPQVGPAFEGVEVISKEADTLITTRYAVPKNVKDRLEALFPKVSEETSLVEHLEDVSGALKRVKLLGSFFQQMDFVTRTSMSAVGAAMDSLIAGKPVEAVKRIVRLPLSIAELGFANTVPARRKLLREQILSRDSIVNTRPGISLRGISEAGASFGEDVSLISRDIARSLAQVANDPPRFATPKLMAKAKQRALEFENAVQNGLFDGVYAQSQITALQNHIVPRLVRQHPDWNDAQIMASAADEVNKMFSTLGNFQTIFQHRGWRRLVRSLFFSTNETESLFRSFFSAFKGPNKRLWSTYWAGGLIFMAATANAIHMATTGKVLPVERYSPFKFGHNPSAPFGVQYNSDFVSPNVPMIGKGAAQIQLDLMGQMDTVFRFFDPRMAIEGRLNVLPRALLNQHNARSFWGRPLEGPVEHLQQLGSDLTPISAGNILGALELAPDSEERLGEGGQFVQALGVNLRAESSKKMLERIGITDDTEPVEKARKLDENPEVRDELNRRIEVGAERGDPYAIQGKALNDARNVALEQQTSLDAELDAGRMTAGEWKDQRKLNKNTYAAKMSEIFKDMERDLETPRGRWFAAMDENELPYGGIDWDRMDVWFSNQPQADQDAILRNIGIYETPHEKEYRSVQARADERGYFDFGDLSWGAVQKYAPSEMRPYIENYGSYKDWYRRSIETIMNRYGLSEGTGRQQAALLLGRNSVGSRVIAAQRGAINSLQKDLIANDPRLAEDMAKWGLLSTQEVERRFIHFSLE